MIVNTPIQERFTVVPRVSLLGLFCCLRERQRRQRGETLGTRLLPHNVRDLKIYDGDSQRKRRLKI